MFQSVRAPLSCTTRSHCQIKYRHADPCQLQSRQPLSRSPSTSRYACPQVPCIRCVCTGRALPHRQQQQLRYSTRSVSVARAESGKGYAIHKPFPICSAVTYRLNFRACFACASRPPATSLQTTSRPQASIFQAKGLSPSGMAKVCHFDTCFL